MNTLFLIAAAEGDAADGGLLSGGGGIGLLIYIVLIGAMIYFLMIKPQKKQRKEKEALMSAMAVGDSVMTTAGFYGVIIDMSEDTVIVEFGSNKNCRIPMQKQAIVQVEKPE